jgi:hypothetical protein
MTKFADDLFTMEVPANLEIWRKLEDALMLVLRGDVNRVGAMVATQLPPVNVISSSGTPRLGYAQHLRVQASI